jgi:predicted RNase H-like nuclease
LLIEDASKLQAARNFCEVANMMQDREMENEPELSFLKMPSIKMVDLRKISEVSLSSEPGLFSSDEQKTGAGFEQID